ncbi:hypothetical protein ACF3M1_16795 [Luteimonas sp. WGS1318]|jgi:hypothetical protein|uniref:hypothetical protein n=1 Tax=Luteimonas sp. WGS1318 TaxID=3366815 RepID=UPI00372D0922
MRNFMTTAMATAFAFAFSAQGQVHEHGAQHVHPDARPTADDASHKTLSVDDFDALDTDKDGYVVRTELPAKHPLLEHFAMADSNRDGRLDRREFASLVGMQ